MTSRVWTLAGVLFSSVVAAVAIAVVERHLPSRSCAAAPAIAPGATDDDSSRPSPSRHPPRPGETDAPPRVEPRPTLAPSKDSGARVVPSSTAAASPDTAADGESFEFHVRGRIVGTTPTENSRVWVTIDDEAGGAGAHASDTLEDDGTFDVAVSVPRPLSACRGRVDVAVVGFACASQPIVVMPGRDAEVTLAVARRGPLVFGRAIGDDGRPAAHLRLRWERASDGAPDVTPIRADDPFGVVDDGLNARAPSTLPLAYVSTDARGRFEVRGLPDDARGPFAARTNSADGSRALTVEGSLDDDDARVDRGESRHGFVVRVHDAIRLAVNASAVAGDLAAAPLRYEVLCERHPELSRSGVAPAAAFAYRALRPHDATSVTLVLRIAAAGRASVERSVVLSPGAWEREIVVDAPPARVPPDSSSSTGPAASTGGARADEAAAR